MSHWTASSGMTIPVAMAREADVDVVVELIGGEDGPAKAVCEAAIAGGRHVVTANKASACRARQ